jgi:hypothetical protein
MKKYISTDLRTQMGYKILKQQKFRVLVDHHLTQIHSEQEKRVEEEKNKDLSKNY